MGKLADEVIDLALGSPRAVPKHGLGEQLPADLAQPQAYRLGIVAPPGGATAATAVLPISAAHAAGTLVTGDLDVCTGPIEFTFDPARVDPRRCHVVVELDVARSVQPALGAGGSPFLLPQFKVVY